MIQTDWGLSKRWGPHPAPSCPSCGDPRQPRRPLGTPSCLALDSGRGAAAFGPGFESWALAGGRGATARGGAARGAGWGRGGGSEVISALRRQRFESPRGQNRK